MKLGEKIKGIRKAKKLTLCDFSKLSGISQGYLSKIESLQATNITMDVLEKISQAVDITKDYLISDTNPYPEKTFLEIIVCESYRKFLSQNDLSAEDRDLLEMAFRRSHPPNTIQGWRDQLDLLRSVSRQRILPLFNNPATG